MKKRYSLRKGEAGQTLIFVAIMLLFIGLVIPSLLALTFTSHRSAEKGEQRMITFYAADAGIEAGLREIMKQPTTFPILFNLSGINDSNVDVDIDKTDPTHYIIPSTAEGFGSTTTIESGVSITVYNLFQNAITSRGDVTIQPGAEVYGDIQYDGEIDPPDYQPFDGTASSPVVLDWPTVQELNDRYLNDVEEDVLHDHYAPDATIDVDSDNPANPVVIGPLHGDGSLAIQGNVKDGQAKLGGTIYVEGNLEIGTAAVGQNFTLDLNGETIFATGDITMKEAVTVKGKGIIIAVKNVTFWPTCQNEPDDFIFIMSMEGWVWFKPMGSFTGSLAGDVTVDLWPGATFSHYDPIPFNLNFPYVSARADAILQTYIIKE